MLEPPASLWWSTLPAPVAARPALSRDVDVDVAIVGGGYTGLWTARELLRRDPSLRVAVLERRVCGFGASGRNGGWASALYPLSNEAVNRSVGREQFTHLRLTLQGAVTDLGESAAEDGIDAQFVQGGSLDFARSDVQVARLLQSVERARELDIAEGDLAWLSRDEAVARGALAGVLGATFTPHCARLHPARLVRGLSDVCESLGVQIFEQTAVTRIQPARGRRRARAVTVNGSVTATYVIRATEGYTPTLPGERRTCAPLYSLMIATSPLSDEFWRRVGLRNFETFADDRHLIIYGQRTADNRIAFGGRGAPYHFGSSVEPRYDRNDRVFELLRATLRELFPEWDGVVTHAWGGPLAMTRQHAPYVQVEPSVGLASAGGYTGDGVVLSRVAAQALADLITHPDESTEFTVLPFVQQSLKRWEIEPLRWVGINAGLALAGRVDSNESRQGLSGASLKLLSRLLN
jgi:glycine/D-amino acid oxidase-like deaminating enzyme